MKRKPYLYTFGENIVLEMDERYHNKQMKRLRNGIAFVVVGLLVVSPFLWMAAKKIGDFLLSL